MSSYLSEGRRVPGVSADSYPGLMTGVRQKYYKCFSLLGGLAAETDRKVIFQEGDLGDSLFHVTEGRHTFVYPPDEEDPAKLTTIHVDFEETDPMPYLKIEIEGPDADGVIADTLHDFFLPRTR